MSYENNNEWVRITRMHWHDIDKTALAWLHTKKKYEKNLAIIRSVHGKEVMDFTIRKIPGIPQTGLDRRARVLLVICNKDGSMFCKVHLTQHASLPLDL